MAEKKEAALAENHAGRDSFALLRQMTSELDWVFERPFGTAFRWPTVQGFGFAETAHWAPRIDVFERDNRLVTQVDLPGVEKEDVKVEVTNGYLSIFGERKAEKEDKKDNVYRCERSYGSFYRAVPLPEGAKLEDVRATFSNGVLEVSVPLPPKTQGKPRAVQIEEGTKLATSAAA